MVNADLIPIVAVDDHKAQFWGQIFENISLYPEIAIHSSGEIGCGTDSCYITTQCGKLNATYRLSIQLDKDTTGKR